MSVNDCAACLHAHNSSVQQCAAMSPAPTHRKLLEDPNVLFAGYKIPHPLEYQMVVKVCTGGVVYTCISPHGANHICVCVCVCCMYVCATTCTPRYKQMAAMGIHQCRLLQQLSTAYQRSMTTSSHNSRCVCWVWCWGCVGGRVGGVCCHAWAFVGKCMCSNHAVAFVEYVCREQRTHHAPPLCFPSQTQAQDLEVPAPMEATATPYHY